MNKIKTLFEVENNTLAATLLVVFIFGCIALLSGLTVIASWIYYSWIKRSNSKNWKGVDFAQAILNDSLGNVEVKKSIFYIKYWNHNKRKNTFRLRHWTYNRESIWTMMEAGQQAYVSSIRETKGSTFWMLFRLPSIAKSVSLFVAICVSGWGVYQITEGSTTAGYVFITLGLTASFVVVLFFEVAKIHILLKNVPVLLEKYGFSASEVKAVKTIYIIRYVWAVIQAVYEFLRLIAQIIEKISGQNENGKSGFSVVRKFLG